MWVPVKDVQCTNKDTLGHTSWIMNANVRKDLEDFYYMYFSTNSVDQVMQT